MFIENVFDLCDRVINQAAQKHSNSPSFQNVSPREIVARTMDSRSQNTLHTSPTVLLVENEPALLDLLREVLLQQRYTVLTAPSAEFAIGICRQSNGPIDVLVCDVLLDKANGFQVANAAKSIFPDMLVILMSGAPIDPVLHNTIPYQLFEKPFPYHDLLAAIANHVASLAPGDPS